MDIFKICIAIAFPLCFYSSSVEGQKPPITHLETFGETIIFPSIYARPEDFYFYYFRQMEKAIAFVDFLKRVDETEGPYTTAGNFARAIIGLSEDKATEKVHFEGMYRQLRRFNIREIDDADSYILKRVVQRRVKIQEVTRHNQQKIQEVETLIRYCEAYIYVHAQVWVNLTATFIDKAEKYMAIHLLDIQVRKILKIHDVHYEVVKHCISNSTRVEKMYENLKYLASSKYMIYMDALYIFFDKIVYALDFSKEGEFNGQPSGPPDSQLGTFELMLSRLDWYGSDLNNTIDQIMSKYQDPSLTSKERQYWTRAYQVFNETQRENNYELQMLYGKDPISVYFSGELMQWRRDAVQDMKNIILDLGRKYIKYYDDVLQYHGNKFFEDFAANDSYKVYYHAIRDVYDKYLSFGEESEYTFTVDNVEYNVPKFYDESKGWKNYNKSNPIHNLYLTWHKVQRFKGKLDCYLNQTYWQFHRDDAVVNSQRPLTRLFGGISKTLFEPCTWYSSKDLVGSCTAENHEICRPMVYSPEVMEKIDKDIDRTYFNPDHTFFQYYHKNGSLECQEVEAYDIPLNICRCGFRTDCGTDLGRNLTCVLEPNDNFRKQCRGSIGYPCKSHPLAPKRHHESCVTGYCDMEEDSCEKDPVRYPLVYSGPHRAGEF